MKNVFTGLITAATLGLAVLSSAAPAQAGGYGYKGGYSHGGGYQHSGYSHNGGYFYSGKRSYDYRYDRNDYRWNNHWNSRRDFRGW